MIGEQVGPTMPAAAALLRPALVRGLPWLRRLVRSPLAALGGAGLASWERAVVCASASGRCAGA
ncbi:MAG: hypothetical protein HY744_08255 [Deltaproteobacteria bacterium]|nr:hypothetical protein [Deltaproteobacteria bacterium]